MSALRRAIVGRVEAFVSFQTFVAEWRGWRHPLRLLEFDGRRPRARYRLVLEADADPTNPDDVTDLRSRFRGWHVESFGETRVRFIPPAIDRGQDDDAA
jgi:hypothetical protein